MFKNKQQLTSYYFPPRSITPSTFMTRNTRCPKSIVGSSNKSILKTNNPTLQSYSILNDTRTTMVMAKTQNTFIRQKGFTVDITHNKPNRLCRGQTVYEPRQDRKITDILNQTQQYISNEHSENISRRHKKSNSTQIQQNEYELNNLQNSNVQSNHKTTKQQGLDKNMFKPLIRQEMYQNLEQVSEQMNNFDKKITTHQYDDEYKINQRISYDEQQIENQLLSLDELNYLKTEFDQEECIRNYLEMDQVLLKNKFFQRFDKGVRIGIIEKCVLHVKNSDEKLIEWGENLNKMYIILRGSCSLQMTIEIGGNVEQQLTIQSYYDGQYVSNLNLINTIGQQEQFVTLTRTKELVETLKENDKIKKFVQEMNGVKLINSSIIIQEQTFLLEMSNDHFQTILIQSIEKDLDVKLLTLSKITFFQLTPPEQLVPLAAILGQIHFYQGDYLIRNGELLDKIFIVQQGEFDILVDTKVQREMRNNLIEKKLKPFKFKTIGDSSCHPDSEVDVADQSFDLSYNSMAQRKCYQYGNKRTYNKNLQEYTQIQVQKVLKIGDLICGRVLQMIYDYDYPKNEQLKYSRVSVVASTVKASVYYLDIKQYQSLPEQIQSQIIFGLKSMQEFDDCNSKEIIKNIHQWELCKQSYYKSFSIRKKQKTYKLY